MASPVIIDSSTVELPDMTAVGEADSCGVVFYGRCNGCLAEKKTS